MWFDNHSEMMTYNRRTEKMMRLREHAYEFGPLEATRINRCSLPTLVDSLTGIETFAFHGELIFEKTDAASHTYLGSGLAVYEFPTFFHRQIADEKRKREEWKEETRKSIDEMTRASLGSDAKIAREIVRFQECIEDLMECEEQLEKLDSDMNIIGGGSIYKNSGVLMGQYEEDGKIVEVYSHGGYELNMKCYRGHRYKVLEFDASTGEPLEKTGIPLPLALPLKIARSGLAIGTLTMSEILLLAAYQPVKRSIAKKVLTKAQENWEERQ